MLQYFTGTVPEEVVTRLGVSVRMPPFPPFVCVQVRAGVSNWDSYHMGDAQEDQEEEVLLQSAVAHLKAVKDAAQEKLEGAQTGSEGKGDSKADAGSAAGKGSTGTTEEEDEQQEQQEEQQSAKKADSKQQEEFSKQVMQDPAVQAAVTAVEKVKAKRKTRQFPLLVSAYLATAAVSCLQQTGAANRCLTAVL